MAQNEVEQYIFEKSGKAEPGDTFILATMPLQHGFWNSMK